MVKPLEVSILYMVTHMYNTSIPELRGLRQKGETFEITQVRYKDLRINERIK